MATEGIAQRPRRGVDRDSAFFAEGLKRGKLLIQHCTTCGTLRHPPRPMCSKCNSFTWDAVEASRWGRIYSYATVHHRALPTLPHPTVVVLVELEEGVRMVGDLVDADKGPAPAIGQRVEAAILADPGDDMLLVRWRVIGPKP
jgi:uncharacterized OB-fold protein